MTSPFHFALGGALGLLLGGCDTTGPVDPAANLTDNVVIAIDEPPIPPIESRRQNERDRVSGSANQEPTMPDSAPGSTPPPAKAPAPPERRVIVPAPTQPPAEVDPVQPYPGDEVPR